MLGRCSAPSSRLHFTSSCLAFLTPSSQHFLRPGERRLVQCNVTNTSNNVPEDFSQLLVILHRDIAPVLQVISATVSVQGATTILQNISPVPFSLHPDKSFAQAVSPILPYTIPRLLPSHSSDLRWSIVSSLDGLSSHLSTKKSPGMEPQPHPPPLQLLYRGLTLLTEPEDKSRSEPKQEVPGCRFPTRSREKEFDLWALGLKCLEPKSEGEPLVVVQVHLSSLWLRSPGVTLHLLPPDLGEEGHSCLTCAGPHPWSSCPAMAPCSCSPPHPHTRLECTYSHHCWNCGQPHNWRLCRQAILSKQQEELTQFGFQFGPSGVTMADTGERVLGLQAGLEHLDTVLAGPARNVLLGYSVLKSLAVLEDAARSIQKEGLVSRLLGRVAGVVDVQWLMPAGLRDTSLFGLCAWTELRFLGRDLRGMEAGAEHVTAAVEGIVKRELDLNRFLEVEWLVNTFGLRIRQGDLGRSTRMHQVVYTVPTQFFRKFKKVQKPKPGDADFVLSKTQWKEKEALSKRKISNSTSKSTAEDDDGDGMLISFIKPIKKPTRPRLHHITKLYDSREQAKVMVLAIKTIELGQKTYLASLSLRSLDGVAVLDFPAIVPRDFYAEVSADRSGECQACLPTASTKASLHRGHDCPAALACTIHPQRAPGALGEPTRHLRRDCMGPTCWNCGALHPWLQCPQPILTQAQHFFSTLGYNAERRAKDEEETLRYTYSWQEDGLEHSTECATEDFVLGQWVRRLGGSRQPTVLMGYCVGEQFGAFLACSEGEARAEIGNTVQGLVDLRWLPRWEGQDLSLAAMLEELEPGEARVGETKDITRMVAKLMTSAGDDIIQERLASTLTCTPFLLSILTTKDLMITGPGRKMPSHRDRVKIKGTGPSTSADTTGARTRPSVETMAASRYLLAYVYLTLNEKEEVRSLDINVYEETAGTSLFSKIVEFDEANVSSRRDSLLGCVNLLLMVSKQKDVFLTVVTVCPNSLAHFQKLWASTTEASFLDTFQGWCCLSAEAYSLLEFHHPASLLLALPLETTRLERLHRTFTAKKSNKGTSSKATTVMREIRKDMVEKYKDKTSFADERPGNKHKGSHFQGRVLQILEDCIYLFIELVWDSKSLTEGEFTPHVDRVHYSTGRGQAGSCPPEDFLLKCLQLWPSLGQTKRLVLVTLDEEGLGAALSLGRISDPNLLGRLVAGVACVTTMLAEELVEQFWSRQVEPGSKLTLGGMTPACRVDVTRRAFQALLSMPESKKHIHSLLSPFTNSILLKSNFDCFSEHFVQVKIQKTIHLGLSNQLYEGTITRPVWNYDTDNQKVMVNFCGQENNGWSTQVVKLKRCLSLVMKLHKRTETNRLKIPYGHLAFLAKDGSQDAEFEQSKKNIAARLLDKRSFGKGFVFFKTLYINYKTKKKEHVDLQLVQEVIAHLQKLGFVCFQDMFDHLMDKCRGSDEQMAEELWLHLQALLCNTVPEPAEVSNILLETVYRQLQLRDSLTVKSFAELKKDQFPKEWKLRCLVDGTELESLFEFTNSEEVVQTIKNGNKARDAALEAKHLQNLVAQKNCAKSLRKKLAKQIKVWLLTVEGRSVQYAIDMRYADTLRQAAPKDKVKVKEIINNKIKAAYRKEHPEMVDSFGTTLEKVKENFNQGQAESDLGKEGGKIEVITGRCNDRVKMHTIQEEREKIHSIETEQEDAFIKRAEAEAKEKAIRTCQFKPSQIEDSDDDIQIIEDTNKLTHYVHKSNSLIPTKFSAEDRQLKCQVTHQDHDHTARPPDPVICTDSNPNKGAKESNSTKDHSFSNNDIPVPDLAILKHATLPDPLPCQSLTDFVPCRDDTDEDQEIDFPIPVACLDLPATLVCKQLGSDVI